MGDINIQLLQKLLEDGVLSAKNYNKYADLISSGVQDLPKEGLGNLKQIEGGLTPPPEPSMRDKFLARFGNDSSKAEKALGKASNSDQPYAHTGIISGMPTTPNFDFKITQPMQEIGYPGLQEPHNNKNIEPAQWMDDKYKILKNSLLDAKENNIPVKINTSSDLIGKDDYISALPKGSEVNVYLPTNDEQFNRVILPGNPSRKRLEDAIQRLQDNGVNVNAIEPDEKSIRDVIANKTKAGSLDFGLKPGSDEMNEYVDQTLKTPGTLPLKVVTGVAPIAGASAFQDPTQMLGDISQKYNQAKEDFYRPIANELDFTQDKSLAPGFTKALSAVADPINAIEGPLGAAAQVTQGVGDYEASQKPNGYADGGFIPDDQFVPDSAPKNVGPNFIPDSDFQPDSDKYGSVGQQALAGIEGMASSIPGADALANKLRQGASAIGIDPDLAAPSPEARTLRAETNPVTHVAGAITGAVPLIQFTGGVGAGLADTALAEGLPGAVKAATGLGTVGSHVLAGAAEGAMLGANSAVSDYSLGDPNLNAQKVLTQIGLGSLFGTGAGLLGAGVSKIMGKFGVPKGSISDVVQNEIETSNNSAKTADALENLTTAQDGTPDPEIKAIALRQKLPVLEGMQTDNQWVKRAEDALINGAPTYSGIKRAALYGDAFNQAVSKIAEVVPDGDASGMTKASVGQALQNSLGNRIAEETAPISELYDTIKQTTQDIPLADKSAPTIARNILNMKEVSLSPSSPEAKLGSRVADEISNLKTVDDVKAYRSILNRSISPTASAGEKRMLAILSDKLSNLEESSIDRYVTKQNEIHEQLTPEQKEFNQPYMDKINSLTEQKAQANAAYKPFIEKVRTLAEQLGKRRVFGPQDAAGFIQDLGPEQITQRLFSKNNSQFLSFFEKNFPEEMSLMREYQKQVLREGASKSGIFSPKVLFNNLNKLEPEVQRAIFYPDELAKLKDVEAYLNKFPKNFNPSGTAHTSAFREFFKSPTGALISNGRDFVIEGFIKTMGSLPENMRPNPVAVGTEMAQKFNRLNAIRQITDRTDSQIANGVRGIFIGGASAASDAPKMLPPSGSYADKSKRIEELAQNPEALQNYLSNQIDGITDHLPNVAQSAINNLSNTIQFLNSKIPRPSGQFALSHEWEPSRAQIEKFNSFYDAVNNPIGVLDHIKDGTLDNDQLESLISTSPDLYKHMQDIVSNQLSTERAKNLPPYVKNGLSMFLGRPVDENTYQPVMAFNQGKFAQAQAQKPQMAGGTKSTIGGLKQLKVSERATTGTQSLESTQD